MTVSDTEMYFRFFRKVLFLKFLKLFRALDFTGRIQAEREELRGYEGCYPVRGVLNSLLISESDSILDIGCGKGLFLYYARKYPFKRISGIDLCEDWVLVAQGNIRRIGDKRIDVRHCDARYFDDYYKYNFFFINNPFCEEIMRIVVSRLVACWEKSGKRITVIYQFPYCREIFVQSGFVVKDDDGLNVVLTLG